MKYYEFVQNNSGGFYTDVDTIGRYVIIEAPNCDIANDIAESMGIYFDGVLKEIDCECCGDRWDRAEEYEAKDNVDDGVHYIKYER